MVLALLFIAAVPVKLPPVDEGFRDPSFKTFRTQLQAAVRNRDVQGLLRFTDPNIRLNFGSGGGTAELKKALTGDGKTVSPLWKELGDVLALGATKEGAGFWAPYLFTKWPENVDPFENAVAMGKAVPFYDKPGGKVLETLDYEIVQRKGAPISKTWSKVASPSKKVGYIRNVELRSAVDYRAYFIKKAKGWQMESFVRGD